MLLYSRVHILFMHNVNAEDKDLKNSSSGCICVIKVVSNIGKITDSQLCEEFIYYYLIQDKHALVYNANAVDESWEWVNVKEVRFKTSF